MSKKWLFIVSFMVLASACSTYKTDTKTTFDSVLLSGQKPAIHVGNINENPDKLTLLGWVDARVTQPHWFSDKPSEAQANIILAEKGLAMDADAVIYVTYKTGVSASLLSSIEARGQAVKLKDDNAHLDETPPPVPAPATPDTNIATASQPPLPITATPVEIPPAIAARPQPEKKNSNIPATAEEAASILPTSTIKPAETVSLKAVVEEKNQANQLAIQANMAENAKQCTMSINDIVEYEANIDALNYMLMNAEFLLKKSRSLNNADMASASLRLIQLLEQQLQKARQQKQQATAAGQ